MESSIMASIENDGTSLPNNDLQLGVEEYIVPLFMEGQQRDRYKELVHEFMQDGRPKSLAETEQLLSNLRALETCPNLDDQNACLNMISDQDRAYFATRDCIKIGFLHALLQGIRNLAKHIVLVVQDDNGRIFDIIEQLCILTYFQYSMPTRDRHADPARVVGNSSITVFSTTAAPIIRPPDAIICLDGIQNAEQIRQRNWAMTPDLKLIPVLHLVISQTVGHIERCLSSSLGYTERPHTIFALGYLSLMHHKLGEPIDKNMPRAPVAAELVTKWLRSGEYDTKIWPLGPIGRADIA